LLVELNCMSWSFLFSGWISSRHFCCHVFLNCHVC
jgi:hypothetical protein